MSVWELRRCPACGYEAKPRRRRPDRAMELACHVCKDEMVTVALTETTATADPSRCEDPLAEMLEAVLRRLEYSHDYAEQARVIAWALRDAARLTTAELQETQA